MELCKWIVCHYSIVMYSTLGLFSLPDTNVLCTVKERFWNMIAYDLAFSGSNPTEGRFNFSLYRGFFAPTLLLLS